MKYYIYQELRHKWPDCKGAWPLSLTSPACKAGILQAQGILHLHFAPHRHINILIIRQNCLQQTFPSTTDYLSGLYFSNSPVLIKHGNTRPEAFCRKQDWRSKLLLYLLETTPLPPILDSQTDCRSEWLWALGHTCTSIPPLAVSPWMVSSTHTKLLLWIPPPQETEHAVHGLCSHLEKKPHKALSYFTNLY